MNKNFVIGLIILLGCHGHLIFEVKVKGTGNIADYEYLSDSDETEHNRVRRVIVDEKEENDKKQTHVSVPAIAKQTVTLFCRPFGTLRNAKKDFTETKKEVEWKEFDKPRSADQDIRGWSFLKLKKVEEGMTLLEGAQGTYSCTYEDETIFFYVFIIPTIKEQNTEHVYDNKKHVEKELNDLQSNLSEFLIENDALVGDELRGHTFSDKSEIDTVEKGKEFQKDQKKLLEKMLTLENAIKAKQKDLNLKIDNLEKLIEEDTKYWSKGEISNADRETLEREIRENLQSEIEILKEKEANLKYTQDALAVSIGIWGGILLIFCLYQLCKPFCSCERKSDEFDLEDGSNSGSELSKT